MQRFDKILMQILIACFLLSFFVEEVLASNVDAVEFFASNNTEKINMQTAYTRLVGKQQSELRNSITGLIKKNHLDKGSFENILGVYRIRGDKNLTADNTEKFVVLPCKELSDKKIFFIAKKLAADLNQESTAVFIPNNQFIVGDVSLEFVSMQLTINETLVMLREKLPAVYSEAFTLHLHNQSADFNTTKVSAIEWLGSKLEIAKIKQSFPLEKVSYHYGKAFLVYKDGHKQQL